MNIQKIENKLKDAKAKERATLKEAKTKLKLEQEEEQKISFNKFYSSLNIPLAWKISNGVQYVYGLTDKNSKAVELLLDKTDAKSFKNYIVTMDLYDSWHKLFYDSVGEIENKNFSLLDEIFKKWSVDINYQIKEDIKVISDDPSKYCYTFCDIWKDLDSSQEKHVILNNTPNWWNFVLKNMNYHEQFCAGIAGIFNPKYRGRQALVVIGDGDDGKSIVNRVLSKTIGSACTIDDSDLTNNHAYANIYDKRLIVNPDCRNRAFLKTELIHKITGRDFITVNPKYKIPFQATIDSVLLICCNSAPIVDTYMRNEISRIMLIRLTKPEFIIDIEKKLYDEIVPFLTYCKKCYEELCKNDYYIECPQEMFESIKDECASNKTLLIEEWIDNNIIPKKGVYIQRSDINKIFIAENKELGDTTALFKLLTAKFNISETFYDKSGKKIRGFKGLSLRHFASMYDKAANI